MIECTLEQNNDKIVRSRLLLHFSSLLYFESGLLFCIIKVVLYIFLSSAKPDTLGEPDGERTYILVCIGTFPYIYE